MNNDTSDTNHLTRRQCKKLRHSFKILVLNLWYKFMRYILWRQHRHHNKTLASWPIGKVNWLTISETSYNLYPQWKRFSVGRERRILLILKFRLFVPHRYWTEQNFAWKCHIFKQWNQESPNIPDVSSWCDHLTSREPLLAFHD